MANNLEGYKKRLAELKKIENPNDWIKNQIRHAEGMIKNIPIEQAKRRRLRIQELGEDFNPAIEKQIGSIENYLKTWRKGQFKKDGKYRGEIENPLKGLKSRYSSAEEELQGMITPTTRADGSPVLKNDGSQFVKGPVFAWENPKLDAEYRKGLEELKINMPQTEIKSSDTPSDTSANWSSVFTIDPETGESLGVITKNQREAFEKKYKNKEYLQSILNEKKIRDRGIYLRQGG